MPVDERDRHRLYLRLEEVLGRDEAGTLMEHLPPVGHTDLATKADLAALEERLTQRLDGKVDSLELRLSARIDRSARALVMWTSGMVLATGALAFAAGRFV
jgi:hypothetical protein